MRGYHQSRRLTSTLSISPLPGVTLSVELIPGLEGLLSTAEAFEIIQSPGFTTGDEAEEVTDEPGVLFGKTEDGKAWAKPLAFVAAAVSNTLFAGLTGPASSLGPVSPPFGATAGGSLMPDWLVVPQRQGAPFGASHPQGAPGNERAVSPFGATAGAACTVAAGSVAQAGDGGQVEASSSLRESSDGRVATSQGAASLEGCVPWGLGAWARLALHLQEEQANEVRAGADKDAKSHISEEADFERPTSPEADYGATSPEPSPEPTVSDDDQGGASNQGQGGASSEASVSEPLPEPLEFGAPEKVGESPSQERIEIYRACCGMRLDNGVFEMSEVHMTMTPWIWLKRIRTEVATECNVDVNAVFGRHPTQACLSKLHNAVRKACQLRNGRMWMARWPWLDEPEDPVAANWHMGGHELKNMVKVICRYLFGSPWIPDLFFVMGKLNAEILEAFMHEREVAYRSNQALYQICQEDKDWNIERFYRRESTATKVRNSATRLKEWHVENVSIMAEGDPKNTNGTILAPGEHLPQRLSELLESYLIEKEKLEKLSYRKQDPRVDKLHALSIPIRVALHLEFRQRLTW